MQWCVLVFALVCFCAVQQEVFTTADCYDSDGLPVRCVPQRQSFSLGRLAVTNSTCGTPPNDFCTRRVSLGNVISDCSETCNAAEPSNAHPPELMTDFLLNEESWWQSENDPSTEHTVVIDLSLGGLVEISVISFNFISLKPSAFKIFKSVDSGDSYTLFHLFSTSCLDVYEVSPEQLLDATTETTILCQQINAPPVPGQISFFPEIGRPSANDSNPGFSEALYNFITASDVRVVLQQHFPIDSLPPDDPGYYYAIEDFNVVGSCQCHGHASQCQINLSGNYECLCQHNTSGQFCQRCRDFYRDVPWQRADGNGPFECAECDCNNHTNTCVFDELVYEMSGRTSGGVCINCSDNTQGLRCESCSPLHYPQPALAFTNPNICLPCDCDMRGVRDSGECAQEPAPESGVNAGDCFCKANVEGRNCGLCIPAFFNLSSDNSDGCEDCLCNETGSISANCDQLSGMCSCKPNIVGPKCDACRTGFYNPDPTSPNGCVSCNCNLGGAVNGECDSLTGQCLCRPGVTGSTCSETLPGYFFPEIDHLRLEGEDAMGFPSYIIPSNGENSFFTGTGFYRAAEGNGDIAFGTIIPPVSGTYEVLFRYNLFDAPLWESAVLVIEADITEAVQPFLCGSVEAGNETAVSYTNWVMGVGMSISQTFCLRGGQQYSFILTDLNSGLNYSASLEIDSLVLILVNTSELAVFSDVQLSLEYADCVNDWRSVQTQASASASCEQITFTFSTAIFSGALECMCDTVGSAPGSVCNPFGGQCMCLPGVRGRQCDQCMPRFFNLSTTGCNSCNCNRSGSQSDLCDASSGACQCVDNVVGLDCSTCAPNHWAPELQMGCIPCNCNSIGSASLQCDQQNGTCECRPGVEGSLCDGCQNLFFGFSENGCSNCDCNQAGSISATCDINSGQCSCRLNARERECSQCVSGTFNLLATNPDGCQPCFCSGLSDICNAADNYIAGTVETVFGVDETNPLDDWSVFPNANLVTPVLNGLMVTASTSAYLVAPEDYIGNKLSSYAQYFTLTLTALNETSSNSAPYNVLLSGNGLEVGALFDQSSVPSGTVSLAVQLHEAFGWVNTASNEPVTAFDLQLVLSNLDNISISIDFDSDVVLHAIALVTAVPSEDNETPVTWVEQCTCPDNYTGLSCEQCAEGYTRSELGLCELCECNGFSETCDTDTGACTNCSMSTTGASCEQCIQGTFGDPLQGIECLPCPCPASDGLGQFSDECELQSSGDVVCLNCPQGHIGQRCQQCDEGFSGDPTGSLSGVPTMCSDCTCNGNIDINISGSCDTLTGVCLLCLNDTGGSQCERCADGFYGDAIFEKNCTDCDCVLDGSTSLTCNYTSGQCSCLSNVVGQQCDRCAPNHYGLSSGSGCLPCDCHPNGTVDAQCLEDGQCICQPGVTGQFCDQCLPGFFGLSSGGCEACACSPVNSINQECFGDGVCICQPTATGNGCEECIRNHFQADTGCTICPQCYQELENEFDRINATRSSKEDQLNQLTSNISSEMTAFDLRLRLRQDVLQELLQTVNELNIMEDILMGRFEEAAVQVLDVLSTGILLLDSSLSALKRISTPVFVLASTSEELMNRTIEEFQVTLDVLSVIDNTILPEVQRVATSINDSFIDGNTTAQALLLNLTRLLNQSSDIRALVADITTHGDESLLNAEQLYSLHTGTANMTEALLQSRAGILNNATALTTSLASLSMTYYQAMQNLMELDISDVPSAMAIENLLSDALDTANDAAVISSSTDLLLRRLMDINGTYNSYQQELQRLYDQSIEHEQNATTIRLKSEGALNQTSQALGPVNMITESAQLALEELQNYSNGTLSIVQSATDAIEAANIAQQAANLAVNTSLNIQRTTDQINSTIRAISNNSQAARELVEQLEQDVSIDVRDLQVSLAMSLESTNTSLNNIASLSSEANILLNELEGQQAQIGEAETSLSSAVTLNSQLEELTTQTEAQVEQLSMMFGSLEITSLERVDEIRQLIQTIDNSADINEFYASLRDTLSRQRLQRMQLESELELLKQDVSYLRHINSIIPNCDT